MPIFDTPEPITAVVDIAGGRIRVTASERADTVVEVRPHNENRDRDVQAAEETRVEYAQGRLSVKGPKSWVRALGAGTGPGIDVDIELPERSALDVSSWANVSCHGLFGNVTVGSTAGDITVERGADVRLKASAGDITVGRIDGHGDLTTSAGAVRIDHVAGTVVGKVSAGELTVGEVTGDLRMNSAYGDVRLGRVLASVGLKTSYGKVRVAEAVRGSIVIDGGYGDMEIGVAEGTAAWLDVSSKTGVVRSELTASDAPADTGETVEIRARSQHGDVIVRRA